MRKFDLTSTEEIPDDLLQELMEEIGKEAKRSVERTKEIQKRLLQETNNLIRQRRIEKNGNTETSTLYSCRS